MGPVAPAKLSRTATLVGFSPLAVGTVCATGPSMGPKCVCVCFLAVKIDEAKECVCVCVPRKRFLGNFEVIIIKLGTLESNWTGNSRLGAPSSANMGKKAIRKMAIGEESLWQQVGSQQQTPDPGTSGPISQGFR